MFFKKEKENKQEQPQKLYKATYKSLHSGNIKEFKIECQTKTLTSFLQKGENIWEMYMLVSVTPLEEVPT